MACGKIGSSSANLFCRRIAKIRFLKAASRLRSFGQSCRFPNVKGLPIHCYRIIGVACRLEVDAITIQSRCPPGVRHADDRVRNFHRRIEHNLGFGQLPRCALITPKPPSAGITAASLGLPSTSHFCIASWKSNSASPVLFRSWQMTPSVVRDEIRGSGSSGSLRWRMVRDLRTTVSASAKRPFAERRR